MHRFVQFLLGVFLAALIIGSPLAYWHYYQTNIRNFRVVREGVLYRSGQMRLAGLKRTIHDYGIKTVITLRDAAWDDGQPVNPEEETYCKDQEINYYRIPPRNWEAPDGSVPAAEGVRQFLEIMDKPENYPVLVHCFAGIHRTGAYCAIYRMEYDQWTNARAMAEVEACGYWNLQDDLDICHFLETYHARWQGPQQQPVYASAKKASFQPVKRGKHKTKKVPG